MTLGGMRIVFEFAFNWSIRTLGIVLHMLWLVISLSLLFLFIRVGYPLCGTEVGSFSAGHLRRNPLFCHIPGIPYVTPSVLANRMPLFLWNRTLFSILIAYILF
jgi:hypothetical protein